MTKANTSVVWNNFYDVTDINPLETPFEIATAYLKLTDRQITVPTADDLITYLELVRDDIVALELESFFPSDEAVIVVDDVSPTQYFLEKDVLEDSLIDMEGAYKDAQCVEALLDCVSYRKPLNVSWSSNIPKCGRCGEVINYEKYTYCRCCGQLNYNSYGVDYRYNHDKK